MIARDQPNFAGANRDLLIVSGILATTRRNLQFERLFIGLERPDFGKARVQMIHRCMGASVQNCFKSVAAGKRQANISAQSILPGLKNTNRFRLLALCLKG